MKLEPILLAVKEIRSEINRIYEGEQIFNWNDDEAGQIVQSILRKHGLHGIEVFARMNYYSYVIEVALDHHKLFESIFEPFKTNT